MLTLVRLYLPVLFPSWRFFKEVRPETHIEVRIDGVWSDAIDRPARLSLGALLARLFWNPSWNEALFVMSCAERLLVEPNDHSAGEIRARVARRLGQSGPVSFRLAARDLIGAVEVTEVAYQSRRDDEL